MPVEFNWYNEVKTIVFFSYSGAWTLDEFYTTDDTIKRLLYGVENPVVVIADFTDVTAYPDGAEAHFMLMTHRSHQHRMVRHFVIVAPNEADLSYMAPLFARAPQFKNVATLVEDREEGVRVALKLIQ